MRKETNKQNHIIKSDNLIYMGLVIRIQLASGCQFMWIVNGIIAKNHVNKIDLELTLPD